MQSPFSYSLALGYMIFMLAAIFDLYKKRATRRILEQLQL